jgi:tetratricopeptide (TPR) repeat protein
MKTIAQKFGVVFLLLLATTAFAQRKISGIVYKNGQPAAGIVVEAHKSNDSYYTSFDGKYELNISDKTKFLRFAYGDEVKKLDIEGNTSDVINFNWDGGDIPQAEEQGVDGRTLEQLSKDRVSDFLNNYSLYREYFKQEDYKSAMPHWRVVYKTYPKSTTQIYLDGLKIYESYLTQSNDSRIKLVYLDSMMKVYDKRIKYFGNEGEQMGRKADKYLETILQLDLPEDEMIKGVQTGYQFAQKSITASGDKTMAAVLVLYMQSSRKLYSYNVLKKSDVLDDYEKVMSIIDKQMSDPELKDKAAQAAPIIEKIVEDSGVLDCATMNDLYGEKFKNTPNDVELLKKIVYMLRKEDCTDGELYASVSEQLYKLQPNADAAFNMARMFLKKKDYDKAFDYYKQAYETETNPDTKASYYYEAGMLALQREKLQMARDLVREAIKLKADYCQAYMLLGEVYGQASKSFEGDDFDKSTVFWVAVDCFEKAARYDDCKADAENKAKFYSSYFPNKEEAFFRGLSEGQKQQIGGWINETTTVRVKK